LRFHFFELQFCQKDVLMADETTPPSPVVPQPIQPAAAAPAQITATPIPKKPKQDRAPENDPGVWRMGRKRFLTFAGWLSFLGFIGISTVGSLRYMFPRVLFEPPTKFKAGLPGDYMIGEVSEKYKDSQRIWIVREKE
jgi:hypothetical protein